LGCLGLIDALRDAAQKPVDPLVRVDVVFKKVDNVAICDLANIATYFLPCFPK
jgi:hypothetical protein